MRHLLLVVVLLVAGACSPTPSDGSAPAVTTSLPSAPATPEGELPDDVTRALGNIAFTLGLGPPRQDDVDLVVAHGDPRVAWDLADAIRFEQTPSGHEMLVAAAEELTGLSLDGNPWTTLLNALIAWDLPATPGYADRKIRHLGAIDERWPPILEGATVDWRLVGWGGVFIDDRELGDTSACPRGCIPALDDPAVTDAEGGAWYPDDAIVFGVVVGDEARAYPKNQMEVHEMVNDTLGGRRLGIPYCTLCGSAQAYLTDAVPEGVDVPVLRTSGLLIRSNKMMYDLRTGSLVDTFTGEATSGPLAELGVVLPQVSVVTATWGDWRAAHPDTTIVARDGGIGREYPADPLGGRDDDGPIFPVGDVDPRLPVQEKVLGLIEPATGDAWAVPVAAATLELADGGALTVGPFTIRLDGGLVATNADGSDAGAHEAFWFAWSQFHPDTRVWTERSG